jgi:hypothetical protein
MELEIIMLSKINQTQKGKYCICSLYAESGPENNRIIIIVTVI